jgi:YHS domain-containing protein
MIGADIMRRIFLSAALCGSAFMLGQIPAQAGDTVNTGYFGGVAIMGYDPVAYFTDNAAVKGKEEFSYDWLGTPWHFASKKHQEAFMSSPAKYAPQFGGYCAGEVAFDGVTINIDPEAFKIIDGKLYLGYGKDFAADLEAHPQEWLPKAEAKWPAVEARLERGKYY